jgi:hypothetical protein
MMHPAAIEVQEHPDGFWSLQNGLEIVSRQI